MVKKIFSVVALLTLLNMSVPAVIANRTEAQNINELIIWWVNWVPADVLQRIGDEYEQTTGIKVTIVQESLDSYYDKVSAEWGRRGDSFDMVVGDRQWLGQAVEAGHYVDLTDFLNRNGIIETLLPVTVQQYAEYPAGSGAYYAYPTESDAIGWAYRQDLFEDSANQAAFANRYGYPLAVPATWDQLRDIAEFFTRPAEGLYGVAIYTDNVTSGITLGFENVLLGYGADWKDADNHVLTIANAPEAVAALDLYRALYQFAPPNTDHAFIAEMNDVFVTGQAAMVMNYFSFFSTLDTPTTNPYRDFTGYFPMPAGPTGERFAASAGHSISVNSYISDERKQAAFEFIQWFASETIQEHWAAVGGHTCNAHVFASDVFLTRRPYHRSLAETMSFVKAFGNIPSYQRLLEPAQRYLYAYVVEDKGTAQAALDHIAFEMEQILITEGISSKRH